MSKYTTGGYRVMNCPSYIDAIDYSNVKGSLLFDMYQRVLDIVLSVIGLLIGIPLIVIFGILIKVEDSGPITYKQERLGKGGKKFYIYKLRSMRTDAEKFGAQWAEKNDPRITKVGKFIRKTRIDEIPQLFNILKGDMSIVGPRPVILEEVDLIELRKSYNIDKILPGITGWAQINGRDNIGNEEKVKYDYEYLMNKSFTMDLYIIVMTALKVLKRSDIKD